MPGIGDQLALESVITFARNERSGWSGIRNSSDRSEEPLNTGLLPLFLIDEKVQV